MKQLCRLALRWQYPLFTLLACVLSWWSMPLADGSLTPYGPALAALIVLALSPVRVGLADFRGRLGHWRVSWIWYVLAVGVMVVIFWGAFALNRLAGAPIVTTEHLQPGNFVSSLLLLLLVGGQWEEPGWSGYALPYGFDRFGRRSILGLPLANLVSFGPRL